MCVCVSVHICIHMHGDCAIICMHACMDESLETWLVEYHNRGVSM